MLGDPPVRLNGTLTSERTLPFFVITLGFTWLLQLPAVLAKFGIVSGPPQRFLPLMGLGAFGPLVAAVIASRMETGGAGVRPLLGLREHPVPTVWYIVAPCVFGVIYVAGASVYRLCGGATAVPWLYPPENGDQLIALIMFPLVEEPGWRGFALPRLQRGCGALKASLLLGVLWALWHTMMFGREHRRRQRGVRLGLQPDRREPPRRDPPPRRRAREQPDPRASGKPHGLRRLHGRHRHRGVCAGPRRPGCVAKTDSSASRCPVARQRLNENQQPGTEGSWPRERACW